MPRTSGKAAGTPRTRSRSPVGGPGPLHPISKLPPARPPLPRSSMSSASQPSRPETSSGSIFPGPPKHPPVAPQRLTNPKQPITPPEPPPLRLQTCQDVFGIWSHGEELEHLHGPLDAEEAFQVSALWTIAVRKAHDHVRRVARAVAGNRVPVVETASMVAAPTGAGPRGHVRQLLETGFPGRPPMLLAAVASRPAKQGRGQAGHQDPGPLRHPPA